MSFDPTALRQHFPALARSDAAAHFDGPGGSQTPRQVADAVAAALVSPLANRGAVTAAERNADAVVLAARQAMADLLGADPQGVIFGRSMTQLTMDIARTLSQSWQPGDEVVVTRLDHDANIRPWLIAAERVGAVVRWADFDPATGELPTASITDLLTDRTRLVAVTAASNLIGTTPDIPAITAAARTAGALSYVDAVHYTAHLPVDLSSLGADFLACSPYKFCGPHCGALAADPVLLATLTPDKLVPSPDTVPERFELGTLPYELLAGTTAAADFLAGMMPGTGTRRERIVAAMTAMAAHEVTLRTRIEEALAGLGATIYSRASRRTPTLLFDLPGLDPQTVYAELAAHGVNAPAGTFYALECSRALGLGDAGAVRVGLAPYTDDADVDRLIQALLIIRSTAGLRR